MRTWNLICVNIILKLVRSSLVHIHTEERMWQSFYFNLYWKNDFRVFKMRSWYFFKVGFYLKCKDTFFVFLFRNLLRSCSGEKEVGTFFLSALFAVKLLWTSLLPLSEVFPPPSLLKHLFSNCFLAFQLEIFIPLLFRHVFFYVSSVLSFCEQLITVYMPRRINQLRQKFLRNFNTSLSLE